MSAPIERPWTWCASCRVMPVPAREPVCPGCRRAGRERELHPCFVDARRDQ